MGCPDQRTARVDVVNTIESLAVIGASLVAIGAGCAAFGKWLVRRFVKAVRPVVREVVVEETAPLKKRLEAELSGNSQGLRQALNELHVKVDDGFSGVGDRIDTLEQNRGPK